MRTIHTAFLGFGNIGGGVYRLLQIQEASIAKHDDVRFQVDRILVRDLDKPRKVTVDRSRLTTDVTEIENDPEITLVCEFMGGVEPAAEYIERMLRRGKSVVTANKQALASAWPQLSAAAQETGAGLYYEASVCAGIPVIETLISSLQSNEIQSVMGIINGTCNYILTRMQQGMEYEDALREAQEKGLAEPDPTADVGGFDAVCKLSILSTLAFQRHISVEEVYCEGITSLTREVLQFGESMGYTLKHLAIAKRSLKDGSHLRVHVHPVLLPKTHPLASISGAYNAVFVQGNACGDLMLYGQGAGDMPTASSIVSDMIKAATRTRHPYMAFGNESGIEIDENWKCPYFILVHVEDDKPGIMARLFGVFAKYDLSVASVTQPHRAVQGEKKVPIIVTTHASREQSMRKALVDICDLPEITDVLMIRMEE